MGMISVEPWIGIDDAIARITRLASLAGLESELEAAADEILPDLKTYPPERPGQKYVRTFELRDTWRKSEAQRVVSAVSVNITNPTEYGPFVQGDDQAEVHRGRWSTVKKIADDRRGAVRARVQAWVLRTWRGG